MITSLYEFVVPCIEAALIILSMLNPIKIIETVKQEVNAKDFEMSNLLILPIPFLLLSKRRKLKTIELITNVMINGFESAIIIIKNESDVADICWDAT